MNLFLLWLPQNIVNISWSWSQHPHVSTPLKLHLNKYQFRQLHHTSCQHLVVYMSSEAWSVEEGDSLSLTKWNRASSLTLLMEPQTSSCFSPAGKAWGWAQIDDHLLQDFWVSHLGPGVISLSQAGLVSPAPFQSLQGLAIKLYLTGRKIRPATKPICTL